MIKKIDKEILYTIYEMCKETTSLIGKLTIEMKNNPNLEINIIDFLNQGNLPSLKDQLAYLVYEREKLNSIICLQKEEKLENENLIN